MSAFQPFSHDSCNYNITMTLTPSAPVNLVLFFLSFPLIHCAFSRMMNTVSTMSCRTQEQSEGGDKCPTTVRWLSQQVLEKNVFNRVVTTLYSLKLKDVLVPLM